jgi:Tol biopolymer transport system component
MRRFAAAAAAGAVTCCVLLSSAPAHATYRGKNGRIALVTGTGPLVVKTIKRDGSDLQPVAWYAADPAWSPDGTKFAFTRSHSTGPLECSIEISNPDGTGVVDLGGSRKGCDFGPAFTPDGRRVVFVYDDSMGHQVIRSMNVDGGNLTSIRRIPAGLETHAPSVSPDGKTIAIQLQKSDTNRAVFTLRMNGKGPFRQLTPFKLNVGTLVDWSPSGGRIVFTENETGPVNTMLVRPDGSRLTRLTHYDGDVGAGGAGYAPNGRWIVFRRQNNATGRCAIGKMRPNGSSRTHVRRLGVCFGGLDWGPRPT